MSSISLVGLLLSSLLFLGPIVLIIIGIVYVVRLMKRADYRAEERLKIDRENSKYQKEQVNQINELNQRITTIERILKEVE